MRLLITGICGFVGSSLAHSLLAAIEGVTITGLDNLSRPGSELNRRSLQAAGVRVIHSDIRNASDLEGLPAVDWVIDAAANPTVLAGVDGRTSSRQLVEHNLGGTLNLLEYCKRDSAGFILLSTSRVYSIPPLASLQMEISGDAFRPVVTQEWPAGVGPAGVRESFSTAPPVSLYGGTKIASEIMALEYGETYGFPVFINRCGVMAGAGQFGRPDQGIFAYWIHSCRERKLLRYIGFDGQGHQVRDCLHPRDLVPLLGAQFRNSGIALEDRTINLSGGVASAMSLRQLTAWCHDRFGWTAAISPELTPRPFDIPWLVLDAAKAKRVWNWEAATPTSAILEEIAAFADVNAEWLKVSSV
jgi:CDP-paratose 2-epimerase